MTGGTITLRRPRVRNLDERFESRVLPLFARRTREVSELIPELSLQGLAVLRDLKQQGMNAPRLVVADAHWGSGRLWARCTRRSRSSGAGTIESSQRAGGDR